MAFLSRICATSKGSTIDAVGNAFVNVLSENEMTVLLRREEAQRQVAKSVNTAGSDTGLFSQLSHLPKIIYDKAFHSSKLAKIITLVNPLKVLLIEYYMSEGRWPDTFVDLHIDPGELHEPGLLRLYG